MPEQGATTQQTALLDQIVGDKPIKISHNLDQQEVSKMLTKAGLIIFFSFFMAGILIILFYKMYK